MEAARPAGEPDLDVIVELADAAVTELSALRGGPIWSQTDARPAPRRADLAEALHARDRTVVVGTVDGVVVGYGVAELRRLHDGTRLGRVTDLYVDPGARGVGVGEEMMGALIAWCQERGCIGVDSIALPGDRATKNFFESQGLVARAILVHRPL